MRISKHEGLGNDFLIALVDELPGHGPALATRLCARHTGIGADGLIYGIRPAALRGNFRFVLFNADGSRAEVSGNGLRCLGQAIAQDIAGRDGGAGQLDLIIDTDAGPRAMTVMSGGDPLHCTATVDMGAAAPGPDTAPAGATAAVPVQRVGSVDMGNPHIVIEVDNPNLFDMATVGPAIERHYLPTGTNVHLIAAGATRSDLTMAIWERGAGVTDACGSGACAAAAVAVDWDLCEPTVNVTMPGGAATVRVGETIALTGPASFIGSIEIPDQIIAEAGASTTANAASTAEVNNG